ncbi:DNA-3-methyladenine glycosylase [Pedococcus sp. NPDC057267]|uniref:DNA-3-methyladenine glycosylase n=1 Tax=Pedococcus sp. NPDC057267 TaxID=3346077 RepID=UPI00362CFC63
MAGQHDPTAQGLTGPGRGPRLERSFFAEDVLDVAPALLGTFLTVGPVTVRLTEVEAYAGESDPGSHAFRGPTPRTQVMFGRAGHLYVYFTYGMHWCANVVTGTEGHASAVLLRAGEVVGGEEVAAGRRAGIARRDWTRGPARLATTLGLRGEDSGADACGGDRIAFHAPVDHVPASRIRTGPRVGVSGAGGDAAAYPWRFWLADEPSVSVYRAAKPRSRRRGA